MSVNAAPHRCDRLDWCCEFGCGRATTRRRMIRLPMKRPNRDCADNSSLITNWPVELEAQVGRADAVIDKETDSAFRNIILL